MKILIDSIVDLESALEEFFLSRRASTLLGSLICDNRYMHICEEIDDGEALHHSRHTP